MNAQFRVLAIALLMGMVDSHNLWAGMEYARFALHRKDKFSPTKSIPDLCDNPATSTEEPNYSPDYTNIPCLQYRLQGPAPGASTVYAVVAKAGAEGVLAASFGVNYSGTVGVGIDPRYITWTSCTDGIQFPNNDGVHGDFPQPGGGLRITWSTCQTKVIPPDGVHAVMGAFYVYAYSDDQLQLTPNNNLEDGIPELAVADCRGATTDLVQVYGASIAVYLCSVVGFGRNLGRDGCYPEAVASTTWGKLKRMYPATASPRKTRTP